MVFPDYRYFFKVNFDIFIVLVAFYKN